MGLVWLLAIAGVSKAPASEQVYQYGPDPAQMLTVCAPDEDGASRPAVLMLHGGDWKSGSRKGQAKACGDFAARGIVAVPTDYRLNNDPPRTSWPMQFSDAQLAMRWLRANAAKWGVDPGHICAEGDSAGGQLALLLGVVQTIDPADMQNQLPSVSPHANCVVAISGPADLVELAKTRGGSMARLLGTKVPDQFRRLAISGSPALRMMHGVPTLLIHGTEDPVVPFAQAIEMQRAIAASGAPAWLIAHPGGHEVEGFTREQMQVLWPFIAGFVGTERLNFPPGEIPIDQAFGQP